MPGDQSQRPDRTVCGNCGNQLTAGARFCRRCGAPSSGRIAPSGPGGATSGGPRTSLAAPPPPGRPHHHGRRMIAAALALAVAAGGSVGAVLLLRRAPGHGSPPSPSAASPSASSPGPAVSSPAPAPPAGSGTVTAFGAQVQQQATALELPSGGQLYLYGFATGGGLPSSGFAHGQVVTANNAAGNIGAAIAAATSSSDSFSSQSAYTAVCGIGISGFSSYLSRFASATQPGPSETATLVVRAPVAGSLIVAIGVASSSQTISISGSAGLRTDAVSTPQGSALDAQIDQLTADAPGGYRFTLSAYQSAPGQTPQYAAALLGVFVFTPGNGSTSVAVAPLPAASPLSPLAAGASRSRGRHEHEAGTAP